MRYYDQKNGKREAESSRKEYRCVVCCAKSEKMTHKTDFFQSIHHDVSSMSEVSLTRGYLWFDFL